MSVGSREIVTLDIGGTAVKSGILGRDVVRRAHFASDWETKEAISCLRHLDRSPICSEASADAIVDRIGSICERQISRCDAPVAIAAAFPGPCDYERGIPFIEGLAKFGALYGKNLKTMLAERLGNGLPVHLAHDATAAGIGEVRARRVTGRVLMVTLGTGFGSIFLDRGKARRGVFPWTETGELFAEPAFGARADDVFSVRGLDRRLVSLSTNCSRLSKRSAHEALEPGVRDVLSAFGHDLGRWLVPYTRAAGVASIIVGGGLAAYFPWFGAPMRRALEVPVEASILGDRAGLFGAACLCEEARDPLPDTTSFEKRLERSESEEQPVV